MFQVYTQQFIDLGAWLIVAVGAETQWNQLLFHFKVRSRIRCALVHIIQLVFECSLVWVPEEIKTQPLYITWYHAHRKVTDEMNVKCVEWIMHEFSRWRVLSTQRISIVHCMYPLYDLLYDSDYLKIELIKMPKICFNSQWMYVMLDCARNKFATWLLTVKNVGYSKCVTAIPPKNISFKDDYNSSKKIKGMEVENQKTGIFDWVPLFLSSFC